MIPKRIPASRAAFVRGLQLSLRASVAAAVSLAIAQAAGLQYPIYALIAAVMVSDLSPAQTRKLALRRVVATVIGAACGIAASLTLPADTLSIGVGILVAMLVCNLLRTPESAKLAGYVCAIIVITYATDPWWYAFYRLVETVIGIAVAWLMSLVPKLVDAEGDAPTASN
ncbi:MAG: aromatic acid exporter family protein [Reyranellaceae bacterium]